MSVTFSEAFENARDAAAHGFAVFPVHSVTDALCSCGESACGNVGKHPLTDHGHKDATTDERQLLQWNERWPHANWALACGSRVSVIDVDSKAGADPAEIVADYDLAGRPLVRTGEALDSGVRGAHIYCENGVPTGRTAADGVEIRANGAYVLLPGSRHVSGVAYEWHDEARPWTVTLLSVPEVLISKRAGSGQAPSHDPGVRVPHGERHEHLKDFAVRLVRAGVTSERLILAHLWTQFREACEQEPAPAASSIEALARWAADSDIAGREREREQVSTDARALLKEASSILGMHPKDPLIHAWRQSEHSDTPLSGRTESGTTLRWDRQGDMIKPDSLVLPVLAVRGLPGPQKLPLTKPLAMRTYKLLVDATETFERLDAREEAREWIEGFARNAVPLEGHFKDAFSKYAAVGGMKGYQPADTLMARWSVPPVLIDLDSGDRYIGALDFADHLRKGRRITVSWPALEARLKEIGWERHELQAWQPEVDRDGADHPHLRTFRWRRQ